MVYCSRKSFLGGMMMELTDAVKALLLNTAKDLKGSARRICMARTVQALGEGGQRLAERELGWKRGTIRKGMEELKHGIVCVDACLLIAWPQAQRRPSAELAGRYHRHGGWAESSRPSISHQPSLHSPDGN